MVEALLIVSGSALIGLLASQQALSKRLKTKRK